MKIFSLIRRQMTPLFALRHLFLARPNSKEPAMSRKIQFACLFLLLGLLSTAQSGFAQNPLDFGNNFFVTGDYVVAGAYNMNTNMVTKGGITYTAGTINVPDKKPGTTISNPGITGATSVPAGAQIVAALLYWQTVEKVGQTGSGQIGFFRGYQITGVDLTKHTTVSWSSGGCTGTSTGKLLRTYRADVRGFLPQDPDGNILAGNVSAPATYQVLLPSTGNSTPLTLGATLVIIYRILSPDIPLNSIVIYDGAFAQGNASLTMTQKVQGFYQAGNSPVSPNSPVSRLTHIVGSGKSNKFETISLGTTDSLGTTKYTSLPSLY